MAATFKFISDAVDNKLFEVIRFSGTEGLSQLYRYEIHVKASTSRINKIVDEQGLDDFLLEVLNHHARLVTEEGGVKHPVHGMLASFDEDQTAGGYTYYTAVLVPRLWKLSIYRTNEIYTHEKTVDQILESILDQFDFIDGRDYFLSLSSDLLSRDYVCQFRETDFDFISRLMENEGIYYYFEQGENAEKLMIVDGADYPALEKPDTIFDVNAQAARRHETLSAWSRRARRLPTHVSVRDYNPDQPSLDVHGTVDVATLSDAGTSGAFTEYLYGDHFNNEEEAARLARLRAEEIACRKIRYYGKGAVCGFRPGYTFKLKQHPNPLYNGKDYLIVEVSHEGRGLDSQSDAGPSKDSSPQYSNTFVAMDNPLSFRPPLQTKKPRFFGTMTAFVYAEATTGRAEVDGQGRYRVHLPFDRADGGKESSDPNRKASCWVRMSQPFVGENEGMYFPLKGGTEVLLTFINGDPDRPIISSALPNASTPSLLTDQSSTESIIQTGANNKIRMEDKPGSERIIMETPTANSWVRIGAPNDPPNPRTVWPGDDIASFTDATGTWQLVDGSGSTITPKLATTNETVTYRLTKIFKVERRESDVYKIVSISPNTNLIGLPGAVNSATLTEGSNTWTLGAVITINPPLVPSTFLGMVQPSPTYYDADVSFYREISIAITIRADETDLQDRDPGDGIRIRTADNFWLEAKEEFGEYFVGSPSDAPTGIQGMLTNFGTNYKPTGFKNYTTGDAENINTVIGNSHVRVSSLDTFNTQEGCIYDFGGYWNYDLGNSYQEAFLMQAVPSPEPANIDSLKGAEKLPRLNRTHAQLWPPEEKLGGYGERIASGVVKGVAFAAAGPVGWVAGAVTLGVQQGLAEKPTRRNVGDCMAEGGPQVGNTPKDIKTSENKVSGLNTGNTWVSKQFGNAYDYFEGNQIAITNGNSEEHNRGDTFEFNYGGNHEETKINGKGIKTFWSKSGGGEYHEKTWAPGTGEFLSFAFKKAGQFSFSTEFPRPWPKLSISTSLQNLNISIALNAGSVVDLKTNNSMVLDAQFNTALYLKVDTGIGFGINFEAKVGGEFVIKPIVGKFGYEGNGIQAQKDAALKAKKGDLVMESIVAEVDKQEMRVESTIVGFEENKFKTQIGMLFEGV